MDSDHSERRQQWDRRTGADRRSGVDRRSPDDPDAPLRYVGPERRSGTDRRRSNDRRSGQDRRANQTPQDQIHRALDLVAYVAESTDLPDAERRALDSAILRLRFALDRLTRD